MLTIRPIQFCDLALLSEKDPGVKFDALGNVVADWFCICTAVRIKMLIYLLDMYRAQIPFPEQVKALNREHQMWHSWQIGIEAHGYQWALGQQAWEKGLPVVPVTLPGDKVQKWQLSTPHYETGRVRIRGQMGANGFLSPHPAFKRFIKEALDAPYGDHDDTVDAATGAVYMLTSPDFVNAEPTASMGKGFAVIIAGGTGRRRHIGDPYDCFRSNY
jgi:phage terminase large subunit-like protein